MPVKAKRDKSEEVGRAMLYNPIVVRNRDRDRLPGPFLKTHNARMASWLADSGK
jgi:hypothetical protein